MLLYEFLSINSTSEFSWLKSIPYKNLQTILKYVLYILNKCLIDGKQVIWIVLENFCVMHIFVSLFSSLENLTLTGIDFW